MAETPTEAKAHIFVEIKCELDMACQRLEKILWKNRLDPNFAADLFDDTFDKRLWSLLSKIHYD